MSQTLVPLTILLGLGSAILTGLVTHTKAPGQLKALVNLAISLGVGAIEQAAQAKGPFTWHGFLTAAAVAFAAGSLAHETSAIGFLTGPTGLLATVVPGGIGAPSEPAPPVADAPVAMPPLDPAPTTPTG